LVCPWNLRFAVPTDDAAFQPREVFEPPRLAQLVLLDKREFQRLFRRSPLKRAKLHGLLRNLLVVAGNQHRADLVEVISEILMQAEERNVRSHAAWALGQIGGKTAHDALRRALKVERTVNVQAEIESALDTLSKGDRPY
jgi:epoxyqueuosine reductase